MSGKVRGRIGPSKRREAMRGAIYWTGHRTVRPKICAAMAHKTLGAAASMFFCAESQA
jgi:hypothetical protein